MKEIRERLRFLVDVGLDYLTLERATATLSGGEAQRIRLATQIGAGLMGVLYILDEPSIGLHQRDNERLIATLERLRDLGNTVVVVEHDEDTIRAADFVVDMGPGAGEHGGHVIAAGTPAEVMATEGSVTADYLSGRRRIAVPEARRKPGRGTLKMTGAKENNLQNVTLEVPIGTLTVVTGVSGSGKSSLITDTLAPALANRLNHAHRRTGPYRKITGLEKLDKVINIDQSPIGRTPRSNPATYIGLWDDIRALFASTAGGQGPRLRAGALLLQRERRPLRGLQGRRPDQDRDALPPRRLRALRGLQRRALQPRDAAGDLPRQEHLRGARHDRRATPCTSSRTSRASSASCRRSYDVGLGYIRLGQPATTLSGGEAQRVKLASELQKRQSGKTFYILDEPTTGLHFEDVRQLLEVLQRLVDAGNTVLVIEHNLDVIKCADHIVDLGPEGGDRGGTIVAQGTPEEVAEVEGSYTGHFVKRMLEADRQLASR